MRWLWRFVIIFMMEDFKPEAVMLAGSLSLRTILTGLKSKNLMFYQVFIGCELELKIESD
jgi:hypothetical protein